MSGFGAAALAVFVALILMAAVSMYIYYGRLYMRSRVAGATVPFGRMFKMTTSGISAFSVVSAYISVRRIGLDVPLERFEEFARSGGDPRRVAQRIEAAQRADGDVNIDDVFGAAR
jgi:uncharacterized protein YqfA (UPF0365 family)